MSDFLSAILRASPGVLAARQGGINEGRQQRIENDTRTRQLDIQERARQEAVRQQMQEVQARLAEAAAQRQSMDAYRQQALEQQRLEGEARREQAAQLQAERIAAENARAREGNTLRRDLAGIAASARAGAAEKPRRLPASAVSGIQDWNDLLSAAKDAKDVFADTKISATGAIQGRLAGVAGQWGLMKGGVPARAKLANIATAVGKLRSGGAITPSEFERLGPLIPQQTDDEDVVRSKLAEMELYLNGVVQRRREAFGEAGYDIEGGAPSPSAPGTPPVRRRKENPF